MTSKEKRQLRNKLSARAFRNRRKTYINELEDHIKDRDTLIDAIRNELSNFRSENDDLRREIEMLKKAALEPTEGMTPVSSVPASTSSSQSSSTKPVASAINTFNPRKDVPASTSALLQRKSDRSVWGEGGSGYTSVHATFMPDLSLPPPQAKLGNPPIIGFNTNAPRQNMNPFMNATTRSSSTSLFSADGGDLTDSFDAWSTENPFSYRTLEAYRMQLWSRMARDASLARQGVPADMRPKFLKDPSWSHEKPVPATTTTTTDNDLVPLMSNLVSSAISTRLLSSFMSAFQGPLGTGVDGDKVSAVFTGKAGLKVVPNHSPRAAHADLPAATGSTKAQQLSSDADADAALAQSFAHLKVATESMGLTAAAQDSTRSAPASREEDANHGHRSWSFLNRPTVRS